MLQLIFQNKNMIINLKKLIAFLYKAIKINFNRNHHQI